MMADTLGKDKKKLRLFIVNDLHTYDIKPLVSLGLGDDFFYTTKKRTF